MTKRKVILAIAATIIAIVAWFIYALHHVIGGLPDAYARWDIGDVLVDYLKTHKNRWPTSWDDLRPTFAHLSNSQGLMRGGLTFDNLRDRLEIDWHADPSTAIRNGKSFYGVTVRSKNTLMFAGADPNKMVLKYFRDPPHNGGESN